MQSKFNSEGNSGSPVTRLNGRSPLEKFGSRVIPIPRHPKVRGTSTVICKVTISKEALAQRLVAKTATEESRTAAATLPQSAELKKPLPAPAVPSIQKGLPPHRNDKAATQRANPAYFLTLKQVIEMTSFKKSFIHKAIADKTFPAPVRLGTSRRSASRFVAAEVYAWMESLIEGRAHPARSARKAGGGNHA